MPDLISETGLEAIRASFPDLKAAALEAVLRLYEKKPPRWANPEQMLEHLARAAAGDPNAIRQLERMGKLKDETCEYLSDAATQLVALRCSSFLQDADTKSERWSPYVDWTKRAKTDSVITFNYDRVVELAADRGNVALSCAPKASDLSGEKDDLELLKLHGSVDWEHDGKQVVSREGAYVEKPFLGTPGPGKRHAAKELLTLWRHARDRLLVATNIVIVGYSFAAHDSDVRQNILGAIGANTTDGVLTVDIVMGSDTNAPDVRRIARLIESVAIGHGRHPEWGGVTAKKINVRTWPMFAEDFVGLWDPSWQQRKFEPPDRRR